jgi:hypothetical protein
MFKFVSLLVTVSAFSSVCLAQPPRNTGTSSQTYGRETYRANNGQYLGHSVPNVNGGRSYYDNRGMYSRSYQTYNGGQRYIQTRPGKK